MSDLVGNPEDRFSRVAAHIDYIELQMEFVEIQNINPAIDRANSMLFALYFTDLNR